MDNNEKTRFITESIYEGEKTIYDSELDYIITYKPDGSYSACDANGEAVYYIYPDGRGVFYTQFGEIDTGDPITIDQINHDTTFTRLDGTTVTISDRKLVKKVSTNSDGLAIISYYNDDGSRRDELPSGEKQYFNNDDKLCRKEFPDGSFENKYYNGDGVVVCSVSSSGDAIYYDDNGREYKHVYPNGETLLKTEEGKDFVFYNNGTFILYDDETISGNYVFDDENNIIYQDQKGNIIGRSLSSGKIVEILSQDGTARFLNHRKYTQTKIKNGKITYSLINHIEYDEDAYNKILSTLNSIDGNEINGTCSNIENTISSFPDSYSEGLVSGVKSNINGHVDLIKSLSEMTNYSMLAYQACDDELCDILHTLVDSIFNDVNDFYSVAFKENIKNTIERNDGILEYKKDTEFKTLSEKVGEIVVVSDFILEYHPERFGISKLQMYDDLIYIRDNRDINEMNLVMYALKNNCPDNFSDYDFNPEILWEGIGHYDFDGANIRNYKTNSEFFIINGHKLEIAQVLPKDCTSIELLAYNFTKANVINTIRTFPEEYLDAAVQKNNVIVLTCDKNSQDHGGSWGGYYCGKNFAWPEDGSVVINAHGSFYNINYYTVDAVIHEFGHKYDDILNGMGKFDNGITDIYMTDKSEKWNDLYKEYKGILPDIVEGCYTEEGFENSNNPRTEFFAESMVAYFLNPAELKRLCPEVYDEITSIMGHDYGGAYINNIDSVIESNDGSSPNSYSSYVHPTPQPGPGPMSTPAPSN